MGPGSGSQGWLQVLGLSLGSHEGLSWCTSPVRKKASLMGTQQVLSCL